MPTRYLRYRLGLVVESLLRYNCLRLCWGFGPRKVRCLVACFEVNSSYGLTDRFKAISGIYEVARSLDIEFRIQQEEPYSLREYLSPKQYNWDVPFPDNSASHIFVAGGKWPFQEKALKFFARHCKDEILFIHGNSSFGIPHLRKNFQQLFKPSQKLQIYLEPILKSLGTYKSVTFRFVTLLGDSIEDVDGYQCLSSKDKMLLMQKCVSYLRDLMGNWEDETTVLITSDSSIFLDYIDHIGIPGIVHLDGDKVHQHVGFCSSVSERAMLKSFAEFILIGKAQHAYQIKVGPMYASNFPKHAATIGGVPYNLLSYPL